MKKLDDIIKVVIVDDHRLFNDGLEGMLKYQSGIEVLAQVYDSREAEQIITKLNPDVVLIDFNMPHLNGIELTKLLIGKSRNVKIVILSMYHEEMYIDSFKRAGSDGYIFKTAGLEEVIDAIKTVYSGGKYFPQAQKKDLHSNDIFLKKLRLSTRELEVIRLVKEGLKTKDIADKLNISFYTAETHRKNIKLKMGIEGEAAFIKFVYDLNLDEQ